MVFERQKKFSVCLRLNVEDITNALHITEINIPWHVTIPKIGFRI